LYAQRPELEQMNARYRGYHYTQTRKPHSERGARDTDTATDNVITTGATP